MGPVSGFDYRDNISAPPGYLNPAAGDYRLNSGSSCIDAIPWDWNIDPVRLDLDGKGRPLGAGFDMGAFESGYDDDADGMEDQWEVLYQVNTTPGDHATGDIDSDSLSNLDEYRLHTNPNSADTDGDLILDGDEITQGIDPVNPDTDYDGITDGNEVEYSNPKNPDTDNDGYHDGEERAAGTSPTNPGEVPGYPAGIYYVDANATAEGIGTAGSPWRTIHYAVNNLNLRTGNFVLNVAPGTYAYGPDMPEPDQQLSVRCANLQIIGPSGGGAVLQGVHSINWSTAWTTGLEIEADGVILENLEIRDFDSGIGISGNDVQVLNNQVHDNAEEGIFVDGTMGNTIQGNVVYDNGDINAPGYGITMGDCGDTGNAVIGNIVYGHGEMGIAIGNSSPYVAANILYDNNTGIGMLAAGQKMFPYIENNLDEQIQSHVEG